MIIEIVTGLKQEEVAVDGVPFGEKKEIVKPANVQVDPKKEELSNEDDFRWPMLGRS
jgi:hypothetical protein